MSKEKNVAVAESIEAITPEVKPEIIIDYAQHLPTVDGLIKDFEDAQKLKPRNEVSAILVQLYQIRKEFKNL